jgi:transposase
MLAAFCAAMLKKENQVEISVLHRQGKSIREIARLTGHSRNSVRAVLRGEAKPTYGPRQPRKTKLDPYKDWLRERLAAAMPDKIPAPVLLRELQEQGYEGGLSQLKLYVRSLRPEPVPEPVVRFETAMGEQMQADWIVFRRGKDPLSAFVATLGYSRLSYVEFVDNERLPTLLACHLCAFMAFGGVPHKVLYDNMKTVVIERDGYGPGEHRFQPGFLDFAKHYGFTPKLCRPYRAKTKGKVERFNRYLRHSFYVPLAARFKQSGLQLDVGSANREVRRWLAEIANVRQHATLRERPLDRWQAERAALQPLAPAYPGLPAQRSNTQPAVPLPVESWQHPLAVYERLAAEVAR